MNAGQIQLRISLTHQLYDFLSGLSNRFGIPVTQVVKHLIIEKAQKEEFPTFRASEKAEQAYKEAMKTLDQAIDVKDIGEYFKNL